MPKLWQRRTPYSSKDESKHGNDERAGNKARLTRELSASLAMIGAIAVTAWAVVRSEDAEWRAALQQAELFDSQHFQLPPGAAAPLPSQELALRWDPELNAPIIAHAPVIENEGTSYVSTTVEPGQLRRINPGYEYYMAEPDGLPGLSNDSGYDVRDGYDNCSTTDITLRNANTLRIITTSHIAAQALRVSVADNSIRVCNQKNNTLGENVINTIYIQPEA